MDIVLEPLSKEHLDSLCNLFRRTIEHTCRVNKIEDASLVDSEVRDKIENAKRILGSDIVDEYIVCACQGSEVIAVGGYFHCGNDIKENCSEATNQDIEIGSIYVDAKFQRLGLGQSIFEHLKERLRLTGLSRAFIDSGYPTSQFYWERRLGRPTVVTNSCFGLKFRYMIWEFEL